MLNSSAHRGVDNLHYSQFVHFDSFSQLIHTLDDDTQYVFRAYDVRGGLYYDSEKKILGKKLKESTYLMGLTSHFTHTYGIYTSDGMTQLGRYVPTGVQDRVARVVYH